MGKSLDSVPPEVILRNLHRQLFWVPTLVSKIRIGGFCVCPYVGAEFLWAPVSTVAHRSESGKKSTHALQRNTCYTLILDIFSSLCTIYLPHIPYCTVHSLLYVTRIRQNIAVLPVRKNTFMYQSILHRKSRCGFGSRFLFIQLGHWIQEGKIGNKII